MLKLSRFTDHKSIVAFIAVTIAVLALLGWFGFGVGADSRSVVETGPAPSHPADSGDSVPSSDGAAAGGSDGPTANERGTETDRNDGGPDQPVSSDDQPSPTRPAPSAPNDGIDSFDDCAAAGYPIAESYPEQCFTPDGRGFTRQIG